MEAKLAVGRSFEWQKGVLEIVPCTSVQLVMEAVGTGVPSITMWDLKEAIKIVTKGASEPLYVEVDITRERSVARVGFQDPEVAEMVQTTLDTRVVPIGKGRHKVTATPYAETEDPWKAHFFKDQADASTTVQEELFKKAARGCRPDTVVLKGLPCKWFGLRAEEEDGDEESKEGEGLMPLMHSLGWWVVAVEAHRVGEGGRHFDAYVQLRKLSDVNTALSILKQRAVRYVPSGKVVPFRLCVDTTGFFTDAVRDARRAKLQKEREVRRTYNQKLQHSRKERESLEAATTKIVENGSDVENVETVGRAVATLEDLFKRARRLEGQAQGEMASPDSKSLRDLVSTLGQIKAQMTVTERTIRDCQHAVAEAKERERQEQRAASVREARVLRAKELRPIEDGWRVSLDSERLKAAAKSDYGADMAKTAQDAVDAARDLLLSKVEGPLSEEGMEEHIKRLAKAVQHADACVGKGVAGLELQATVTELEARMHRALDEGMEEEEDDEQQEEEEQVAGGSPSCASQAMSISTSGIEWRWPFPVQLGDDPSFSSAKQQAAGALDTLNSLRAKKVDPEDDRAAEALDKLRTSVEKVMGPRRRRHRAVVPRAKYLDRVLKKWREFIDASEPVKRAVEAAELAVKRAYKGVEDGGRDDEELFEVMEKAIDRVETAASNVARRQREEEEDRQRAEEEERRREEKEIERARRREEAERNREENEMKAKVAEAERMKAFLQKTLSIHEAHKRLRQYREHVMNQPPPTQRLLQAGGIQLMLKGRQQKDDESTVTEEDKLVIMTPVPILSRWRGWAAREAIPEESPANEVSEYYWKEMHEQEEMEKEEALQYPPDLRLKSTVKKISEAPKRVREQRVEAEGEARAKPRIRGAVVVVNRQQGEETGGPRRRGTAVVVSKNA